MQRILLVEDNEMNRDLISRRLERRGFDVSVAVDGAEGVERATAEKPDLVVMDMGLPVLDGYEATRMLKESEATRLIPIIGLSAHAMGGDARKALAAGCDDYDTKPVDWKRLVGKIEILLTRAREDAARSAPETAAEDRAANDGAANLLVVDDSAMHRELLSGRLAVLGYRFELAGDAVGAVEKLEGQSFDAVLLDVGLPPVDGQPLLEKIRSDPRWRDLPVLMLSTIDATRSAIECLARGAQDFVPQPFHQEVLAARLESCLELSRLRQQQQGELDAASDARRSEHLLGMILPSELVAELRQTRTIAPRECSATLLFCDVAGFAELSDELEPFDAVRRLQRLIVAFEEIAERHHLEKIKTDGDVFIAAAGLFEPSPAVETMLDTVRCAFEMLYAASALEADWRLRVGLHLGPVVAAVLGQCKVQFDLFGATVRTAARVKGSSPPGAVHVSEALWQQIADRCHGQQVKTERGDSVPIYRVDRVS